MKCRFFKHPILCVIVATLTIFGLAIGKSSTSETHHHTIQKLPLKISTRTNNLNNRIWLFLPKSYGRASKEKPMPLIIYLHGSSWRGRDVEQVKANGLAPLMDERDDFKFGVALPQSLSNHAWQHCWHGNIPGNPMT